MGTQTINVYGRDYAIACDDGEEQHVLKLTQMVNHRVKELLEQLGRAPEHTMLIYTALMLADELLDVTRAYKRLEKSTQEQLEAAQGQATPETAGQADLLAFESKVSGNLIDLAAQMDLLAQKLEKAA